MRSPFPGMDPYLERYWEGVHPKLISYIADELAPQLADDLAARVEERVYIDAGSYPVSVRKPDVRVVEDPLPWETRRQSAATGSVAVAEPVILRVEQDPVTERHVQIMDMDGNRIVTAIEVLSPWNKTPGPGREGYLRKRKEFFAAEANVVEIDLVRAGDWPSMLAPFDVPAPYRTTYHVSIWRAHEPDRLGLYPIALQHPIPAVRVPLRPGEADAMLDLQPLLDRAYRLGRYDRIDYAKPCEPPLEGEEAAWVAGVLSKK